MKYNIDSYPSKKKWAIVDDDPAVLEMMGRLLRTVTSFELVSFNDPIEAMSAIRAEPGAFAMLITDREMPEMSGVELLVMARTVAPDLRFVMITGNPSGLEAELNRFDLPHSVVNKPFGRTALVDAISHAGTLQRVETKEDRTDSDADDSRVRFSTETPRVSHGRSNHFTPSIAAVLSLFMIATLRAHESTGLGTDHHETTFLAAASNQNEVSITIEHGYRVITANGMPDHITGRFPNSGNPNSIAPQSHRFRIALSPMIAAQSTLSGPAYFGVAINGVPFEAGTGEFWNRDRQSGWNYEALSGLINLGVDQNNAHVQPTGAYHYHATPTDLAKRLSGTGKGMVLIGWAADGFPIYTDYGHSDSRDTSSPLKKMRSSYRLKGGTRPGGPGGVYDGRFTADYEYVNGSGDLDECNGRFGLTPEFPYGTYHYYVTDEFPYISRQWKGKPDQSFMKQGAGPGGGRPPRGTWNEQRPNRPRPRGA